MNNFDKIDKAVVFCVDNYTTSFVQTEIKFLSAKFTKVIVVTEEKSNLDSNSNVDIFSINYSLYSTKTILSQNTLLFLKLMFKEFILYPKYFFYPKTIISIASNLLRSFFVKDQIKLIIDKYTSEPLVYSFWFNNWATALSLLVYEKSIDKFCSRTHGTDLYEERVPIFGRIPFRIFQLKYVHKLYSVSKKGEFYLKNKYPQFSNKIFSSYLGTNFGGTNPINKQNIFTVVSCARVRNIKRIYLLAEVLSHINFSLKWIHIGDETLDAGDPTNNLYVENKSKLASKSNIQHDFRGNLTNSQVFELYQTTPVNLFVSVSETEGLPVSMMEAISFGIPILSTDVGGCNEIVTKDTGILIPKDFDTNNVAKIIEEFVHSDMNTIEFRNNIQKFWQINFDNNSNGSKFIESIS